MRRNLKILDFSWKRNKLVVLQRADKGGPRCSLLSHFLAAAPLKSFLFFWKSLGSAHHRWSATAAARWSRSQNNHSPMLDNYIDATDMNGREGNTSWICDNPLWVRFVHPSNATLCWLPGKVQYLSSMLAIAEDIIFSLPAGEFFLCGISDLSS